MDRALQMKLGPMQKMVTDVAVDLTRGVAVPGEESAVIMVSNTADAPVLVPVSIPASSTLRQPGSLQLSRCEHHTPGPRRARRVSLAGTSNGATLHGGGGRTQRFGTIACSVIHHWRSSALAIPTG